MAKLMNQDNVSLGIFLKRMGMAILPVSQLEENPLKEIEIPVFKNGDLFGGSLQVFMATRTQYRPEFVFETQRGYVIVPLYGFFKKFNVGENTDKGFSKYCDMPKYSGAGYDAIKGIYNMSLDERDFVERMLEFFSQHQLRIVSSVENRHSVVKFGPNHNDMKIGYTTYVIDFA